MQQILGLVRRCVEDYHMISPGETVAVGVSGGKDSLLTLVALSRLRHFFSGAVCCPRHHSGDRHSRHEL